MEFDSEPVYNNVLKTKIKSHSHEVGEFFDKEFLLLLMSLMKNRCFLIDT